MSEPTRSRPHMPGYLADGAGATLPWSWAEERLITSRSYWVCTVWPDGRPHASPVWGVWIDQCLWFSCHETSRKARNIAVNPACVVATEDPIEPVTLQGMASRVLERAEIVRYVDAERTKYADQWNDDVYTVDFFADGTYKVTPSSVIALDERTFATSPTKWTF